MSDSLEQLTQERLKSASLPAAWPMRDHVPALLVFGLGVLVTFGVQQSQTEAAARAAQAKFEQRAQEVSTQLSVALRTPLQTLQSLAGVMQMFPQLTAAEFGSYARKLARDDSWLAGVHWLRRVSQAERSALEQQLGRSLLERRGQGWVTASPRAVYLPMVAQAPWEDPVWLGRDRLGMLGDNALDKALQTGQAVASPLDDGAWPEPVIALVQRVCDEALSDTQCSAQASGLVEIWVRLGAVLHEITEDLAADGVFVSLYDLSAAQGKHLIYRSVPDAPASPPLSAAFGSGRSVDIRLADRWLRAVVTQQPHAVKPADSAAILVSGASISALLALLLTARRSLRALRQRLMTARELGPYTLERELGAGSMGTVYLAHHRLLRRPTAVKLLDRHHMDALSFERFEREVQQTAMLCHPNTIAVYDFGRTPDGIFYYAMEYLDGVNLQRLVQRTGRQPAGRVVWILRQAAGALAESHAAGLIHRDIKPANLMLCVRGGVYDFVKVLDFGLVRNLRDPSVLDKNAFVGTPLYAAPEAYRDPDTVDARSDLYSLGATAYFLLTGREPFRGERVVDVLEQHVSAQPQSFAQLGVQDVPGEIEQLVLSCLAKQPNQRPQSAVALCLVLERLQLSAPWGEQSARELSQTQRARLLDAPDQARNEDIALGETLFSPSARD